LSALLGLRGLRRSWPIAFLACLAVFASLVAAPGLAGWLGGALALLMLAIALIDRRQFIIPASSTPQPSSSLSPMPGSAAARCSRIQRPQ